MAKAPVKKKKAAATPKKKTAARKPPVTPTPPQDPKPQEGDFHASIAVNNETFSGAGDTAAAALRAAVAELPPKPFIKTVGIITLEHGDMRSMTHMNIINFRRMIFIASMQDVWAKRLTIALKKVPDAR